MGRGFQAANRGRGRGQAQGRGRSRGRGQRQNKPGISYQQAAAPSSKAAAAAQSIAAGGNRPAGSRSSSSSSSSSRRKRKRGAFVDRRAYAVDGKLDHKTLCWLAGLPPDKRGPAEAAARAQAGLDQPTAVADDVIGVDDDDANATTKYTGESSLDAKASERSTEVEGDSSSDSDGAAAAAATGAGSGSETEAAVAAQLQTVQFTSADRTTSSKTAPGAGFSSTVICVLDGQRVVLPPIQRCFLEQDEGALAENTNGGGSERRRSQGSSTSIDPSTSIAPSNSAMISKNGRRHDPETVDIQDKRSIQPSSLRKMLRKFLSKCLHVDKESVALRPVQARCWWSALSGKNAVVVAPTGSGKTLAFVGSLLPHILASAASLCPASSPQASWLATGRTAVPPAMTSSPSAGKLDFPAPPSPFQGLVLAPTRELVTQICAVCGPTLRRLHGLHVQAVTGGVSLNEQLDAIHDLRDTAVAALQAGKPFPPALLVATPGRLLDLLGRGALRLFTVSSLVVDEADRMLKMGLREQVDAIIGQLRTDKQTILCSATEVTNIFYRKDSSSKADMESGDAGQNGSGPAASKSSAVEDVYRNWLCHPFTFRAERSAHCPPRSEEEEEEEKEEEETLPCLSPSNTTYIRISGGSALSSSSAAAPRVELKVSPSPSSSSSSSLQSVPLLFQGDDESMAVTPEPASTAEPSYDHTINVNIEQVIQITAEHKKPRKLLRFLLKVRQEDDERIAAARSGKEGRARATNRRGVLIFCNKVKTLNFLMDFLAKKLDVPASSSSSSSSLSKGKNGPGGGAGAVPTSGLDAPAEFAKRKRKKTSVVALHGKMSQEARDAALVDFRSGKKSILIATDVASRGLDIKNLPIVVNYDFPSNVQQYVHRIGRCGRRKGARGHAYSFVTRNYMWMAPTLVRLLRSCGQKVDPNLLQLANESGEFDDDLAAMDASGRQQRAKKRKAPLGASSEGPDGDDVDDGDRAAGGDDEADDDYDFLFPEDDDDDGPRVTLSGKRL